MEVAATRALVGIDWGTTNRRAYRLDAADECVAEHSDGEGILTARGRFSESLDNVLAALDAEDVEVPVVMSGMVGSASGWFEAPYLELATPLDELAGHLVRLPHPKRSCFIVPGYRQRLGDAADVMRGEETQLLGAVAQGHRDGWFVLPGTHSKWVQLRDGRIAALTTYMTGELFDLLATHGTLAAASESSATSAEAFAAGFRAQPHAALSNALFGCRARIVTSAMPAAHARSFLSGVLIGAEWHDARRRGGGTLPPRVTIIGSPELTARYAIVADAMNVAVHVLDPRATYLAALKALRAQCSRALASSSL